MNILDLIDRLKKKLPPKKQEKEDNPTPAGQKTDAGSLKPNFSWKSNTSADANKSAKGNTPALVTSSLSSTATTKFGVQNTNNNSSNNEKEGNGVWDLDDDEDVDYQTTNLNKLTPEEVKKHKDKMDVLFKQNQKKPGDPGFIYDKQEEFNPKEDNEWDEEF